MMGSKQLKIGLRVKDLQVSGDLYLKLGFRELPNDEQPHLRYLTFGHTWLILTARDAHGYYDEERGAAARRGPLGLGFTLAVPTPDLDAAHALWRAEGLPVLTEPEDTDWARVFVGLDPDGYEVSFEQFHEEYRGTRG
ncbi:VOC family protein [Streptomyces flavofungini]|uniref:VOC family protein n=1 Tax=Streptomyces flavofungini TaxID=68200 RepID=UPI0025AF96A9|nr:VOC family protein [Streptomyces flavofungini]WJV50213.1 VOC family protein [Streptomyces flavofungini]